MMQNLSIRVRRYALAVLLLLCNVPIALGQSGDFNGNGIYGCDDLDPLSTAILGGDHPTPFDLNSDGLVNQSDLTSWLIEAGAAQLPNGAPYMYGDVDLRGSMDTASDWDVWNANKWGYSDSYCDGDYNVDGRVDIRDFQFVTTKLFLASNPEIGTGREGPVPGDAMRAVYDPSTGNLFATPDELRLTTYYVRTPEPLDGTDLIGFQADTIFSPAYFDGASQLMGVTVFPYETVQREVFRIGRFETGLTEDDFGKFEFATTRMFGDTEDHGPFETDVEVMTILPGDANIDGIVDVSDFNLWNSYKFTDDPYITWGKGDFNLDGFVDVSDFNLWNENKFRSSSDIPISVPEPSGVALILPVIVILRRSALSM